MIRRTRRLRIVEVGLGWPPETFLQRKLGALAAAGLDVRVASSLAPGARPLRLPGIGLERLPPEREGRLRAVAGLALDAGAMLVRRPGRVAAVVAACRRVPASRRLALWRIYVRLARLRADVVHFEWLQVAAACLPIFPLWPDRVVVSCHGPQLLLRPHTPRGKGLRDELPAVFRTAAAVHCVAESVRTAAESYGLERDRAWVIPQVVDSDFFAPGPAPQPGGEFRLVSVGWLRWRKGFEYSLVAVAELVRAGIPVSLTILGGDPWPGIRERSERVRLAYAIHDLGLEGHVRLLGAATPEDVREALHGAHALLQTSLSEGLPNVVLEAMACGLPVVVTDVGGTAEAVRDGVDGFVVPPRDPRAAAAALRRLWDEPGLRAWMGAAARARVEADFRVSDEAEGFLELYRHVANGRGDR